MPAAPTLLQETERQRALHHYDVLDSPREAAFDDLVTLAAQICGTPMSFVTFIENDRQWIKAAHGAPLTETSRALSFCAHALARPTEMLIVPDASLDLRFADNPHVTDGNGIRFYAAVPLCSPGGHALGTLCVVDYVPRTLGDGQQASLRVLGRQVMVQLEMRRSLNETILNDTRLRNSQRIAGLGDWEHDLATNRMVWSEEIYQILGLDREKSPPQSDTFFNLVHPDDLTFVYEKRKVSPQEAHSPRLHFEHRIIRPDGELRYLRQVTERIFAPDGKITRELGTLQDITEQKRAEEVLRQSEERYRMLMTFSPDAQFVHVDGLITLVNVAFCELMGAQHASELLGKSVLEVVHPSFHALVPEQRESGSGGALIPPIDEKFIRLDGSVVEVEVGTVSLDFHGEKEVHVVARDITKRKHSVEELLEKTAFLEAQVDASLDGILVVDNKGKKILQNQRLVTLLRMPDWLAQENDDEKSFQFVSSLMKDSDAFTAKVVYLYGHPEETSRDEVELKDGTTLDRYSSPVRGKDGKAYGRIWTFRDITAQKAAVEALLQSEERFKFVARAVSDVVWDWDLAAGTLWWNDGFLTTFGFNAGEIEPSIEAWTGRIHIDERSRVIDSMRQAIATGVEVWGAEYRFQRKDGSYAHVQDRGYILRSDDGRGVRMVGGMRDLTEQKKMEAQYLRAERMESIGTLAGGIAHDLNNVLTPILMSIELLKLDPGLNARRGKILDIIHTSGKRGAELVRQVLAFARGLEGQRIPLRLQPVIDDLESIISETFPRSIRIVTNVAPDLWTTVGDQTQLHQVLLNLAVNARDAMPQGGTLSFAAANILIDSQYAGMTPEAQTGPYILLQVTDTGMGIPPDVRERIFEPFFTTKEFGKGTGIGLATVHTVVKSHGGFLVVESEVGQGTTFKIYLPAEPAAALAVEKSPAQIELPRGQGELVLVVDDEFSIHDITRQTLEAFGYKVIVASDGAEAVALYAQKSQEIAVVLTDMMMPIMDGAATIQVLLRIKPSVKIIATSGLESGAEPGLPKRPGTQGFLLKPYTAEALLHMLRDVLDRPAGATSTVLRPKLADNPVIL